MTVRKIKEMNSGIQMTSRVEPARTKFAVDSEGER
jgi:hypothetical protein